MKAQKLAALAATTAAMFAAAPAHAGTHSGTTVCNEAENSARGGYVVTTDDPSPPAQLRGSQMAVGHGRGLENAAEHSPALSVCVPEGSGGGGGGPF